MMTVNSMSQRSLMYAFSGMHQRPPSYITGVTSNVSYVAFPVMDMSPNAMRDIMINQMSKQKTMQKYMEFMKDKQSFYKDFDPAMKDLKSSAKDLNKTDFATDAPDDILDRIKDFADDYNAAIDTFKEHEGLSNGIRDLGIEFGETRFKSRFYASIGLNIDNSGRISVDEDKLKDAIENNPSKVEELLGKNGLSGKTKTKVADALKSADDLVPAPRYFSQPDGGGSLFKGMMYPGMMYTGMMFDFFI